MSGLRVEGGSMPLITFCCIRYMARANRSSVSFPVCLVSASPLQTKDKQWTHGHLFNCVLSITLFVELFF